MSKNSKKSDKKVLFDESSDEEQPKSLKTNEKYAKSYNEFRKKELLQKFKDRGDADEDESSSSDDMSTDEEVVNTDFDKEFFKSYSFLVKKDPQKYTEKTSFFKSVKPVEEFLREKYEKREKSKPVTIKDYKREMLLKHGSDFVEEDVSDVERPESPTYAEEQKKLKEDFKNAFNEESDEELLVKREKTREEQQEEQEDYLKWLAGQKNDAPDEATEQLKPLKEFWSSDKLSKEDLFLRDYILNRRYLGTEGVPTYDEIVGDVEEDEKELEEQEEFEYKYNYRFEDPDQEFLKRYPRTIPDSVRAVDNTRKEKRKERKERKDVEKLQKRKEFDELNKLKREELEEKLEKLKKVAQNENFNLQDADLESDFDPDQHDKRMQEAFNDEYYMINEGEQKPEFPELDKELDIEDYDNFEAAQDDTAVHCEDDDFIMDADYDPETARLEKEKQFQDDLIDSTRKKKRKKRSSKLAEMIKKDKPAFDPEEKTYEEYLDEYFKLDYEDVIGDTPCRFKYSETIPNDFGLTIEEILMASNKELNQWASLKKTMQNRPKQVEMSDFHKYKKRAQNVELKKKIFKSIYGPQEDEQLDENILKEVKTEEPPKASPVAKKPKKQKKPKSKNVSVNEEVKTEEPINTEAEAQKTKLEAMKPRLEAKKPKLEATKPKLEAKKLPAVGKKNFKKNANQQNGGKSKEKPNLKKPFKARDKQKSKTNGSEMSEARLRAFGINPKKYYNKLKYGPNAKNNQKPQMKVNKKK